MYFSSPNSIWVLSLKVLTIGDLFLDFVLCFTHKFEIVHIKCDYFVFVVCSNPAFSMFNCCASGIKLIQSNIYDLVSFEIFHSVFL